MRASFGLKKLIGDLSDGEHFLLLPEKPTATAERLELERYLHGLNHPHEQARDTQVPHETYAEPFVGMGGVFFRRRRAPRREVTNEHLTRCRDAVSDPERHYPQFMETLKLQITSRAEPTRIAQFGRIHAQPLGSSASYHQEA